MNKVSKRLTALPLVLGFIVLPLVILGLVYTVAWVSSDTRAQYHELMAGTGVEKENIKKSPYQVSQNRFQIQKDVSFIKNSSPMHMRLFADDAKLVFDHQSYKTEIVEHMTKIVCYMQEELYYLLPDGKEVIVKDNGELVLRNQGTPVAKETAGLKPVQTVRLMEADSGAYYYKADLFQAKNVQIQRFLVEGHEFSTLLPNKKKLMSGVAGLVEFSLTDKNFEFKADKLKAILYEL